jgi:pyrroloquinoline quinone biosynthesis protein E
MPSRAQVERAEATTRRYRERVGSRMQIYFVVPDYFESRPKPCMNGLGSIFLTVAPDGLALPCHAARMLPGLDLPNVRSASIEHIWYESAGFNRYRGDSWMKEPCRSCPEKARDFGGCRCQAFLMTGDAANADPVCDRSPAHALVTDTVARADARGATPAPLPVPVPAPDAATRPLLFRNPANSMKLGP